MATGVAAGYLHGFTNEEQQRLRRQAQFLEPLVFAPVDFSGQRRILEVGCGVGAQSEILLERFPHLHLTGVDASKTQLDAARRLLRPAIKAGRVELLLGDAMRLPFADATFDGAFVCWFLEHVSRPIEVLVELRRVLRSSALVFLTEVQNASLYLHPHSPATLDYWAAFNEHQRQLEGDPDIGAKLANYLLAAGYQAVETQLGVNHFDNRMPKRRAEFIDYWTSLMLSGADGLLKSGKVSKAIVREMTRELGRLKQDPDAVFFYTCVQARARIY